MVKKIIIGSILSAGLILSGCGDSEGENRLKTQQMLDSGDFSGVISRLEAKNNLSDDDYIALGAAYMQKAGLGLSDLITIITESSDDEESEAFASFIRSVANQSSPTALNDLKISSSFYKKVVDSCTTNLTAGEKDICLYAGLGETMKAATTISYLTGNIDLFGDKNQNDAKLKTATCVMEYALMGSTTQCTISPTGNVFFEQSQKTYERVIARYNGESFEYLLQSNPRRSAITKGFCTKESFATRLDEKPLNPSETYYVCPLSETPDTQELTTEDLIVDALNYGLDAVVGVGGEELQESVDEFKCEILDGNWYGNHCSKNINTPLTVTNIINYLNKQ